MKVFKKLTVLAISLVATQFIQAQDYKTIGTGNQEISGSGVFPLRIKSSGNFSGYSLVNSNKALGVHFGSDNIGSNGTNSLRFGLYNTSIDAPGNGWLSNPLTFDMDAPNGSLVMNYQGYFGLGTFEPQAPLSFGPNGTGKKLLISDFGDGGIQTGLGINMSGDSRELSIFHSTGNNSDGSISFGKRLESNGTYTQMMKIFGNGNVGIGTTDTKGYKLAVNGSAIFTLVKVIQASTPWPDYVFHKTYNLRPLSEVEQFIQQNHHLPEVPSAAEVEKNGLDLGTNQAVLLKKIEELTLYTIEQNKKLEEQNKKLALMEQKLNELMEKNK